MAKVNKTKEQRVNIPLGKEKRELANLAKGAGTTETNLARIFVIDGIRRMKSGEIKFQGPAVISTEEAIQ